MHSERVKNIELTKLIESPAVTERGTFLNHLNKKIMTRAKRLLIDIKNNHLIIVCMSFYVGMCLMIVAIVVDIIIKKI